MAFSDMGSPGVCKDAHLNLRSVESADEVRHSEAVLRGERYQFFENKTAISSQPSAFSRETFVSQEALNDPAKTRSIGMFRVSPLDLGMTGEGRARGAPIAEIAVIARHRRDRKTGTTTDRH